MKRLWIAAAWVLAASAGASGSAWGQAWPSKPIRLVIGYTPGGAADVIARIVGEAMSRELGQPITIDNKPGAGSTLASDLLAHAPPDGYTLGLASGTLYGIDQQLYKVRYTPADFTPITRFTISPLVLAVNKELGVASVEELVARLKATPGQWNYSSSGIGGSPHLAGLTFERLVGAKMTHIPYKGGAPALQAVAAGDVQLSFGTASSVLPMGQQGVVKMLGVTTARRSAVAPELTTIADSGLPGFEFQFWFGLFGPARLPPPVVERLFAAATKVLSDADVKRRLLIGGNEALPSKSPAEFHEWASADGRAVRERAEQAGVKLE